MLFLSFETPHVLSPTSLAASRTRSWAEWQPTQPGEFAFVAAAIASGSNALAVRDGQRDVSPVLSRTPACFTRRERCRAGLRGALPLVSALQPHRAAAWNSRLAHGRYLQDSRYMGLRPSHATVRRSAHEKLIRVGGANVLDAQIRLGKAGRAEIEGARTARKDSGTRIATLLVR